MNITNNNTMIYVKEDENGKKHYRARVSRKNQNNEYENGYIDIRLPKDTELENKTKIDITKGFLSFYNYKDKEDKQHTIWYIVVQEYSKKNAEEKQEINETKQENSTKLYEDFGNQITVDDLDMPLPF